MHISTISVSGNNFAEGSYIENNNITEDIIRLFLMERR